MSNFIKAIAMQLKDRQEFEFNAKKIGEDLVLMIQCDKKGSGKVLNITVPAADLETEIDAKIIEEINRPDQKEEAKYQATTTDKPEGSEDDDDEDNSSSTTSTKKAATKKSSSKKKPVKKAAPVKKKAVVKKAESKPAKKEVKKEKPAVQETPKEVDTTKEQFEAAMTEGKRLFDERKYQEAAESYKKATELNPESEPAKKLLANAERWVKQMNNIKTA